MKLIATIPCRNEAWCIGLSARVALLWCDEIVVLDHCSTDRSASIILDVANEPEHKGRVHLIAEADPKWDEMQHRQRMLEYARHKGATHIAIVDADEVLTANTVREAGIRAFPQPGVILQLPGYNLRGGLNRYHSNGIWGNRFFSTVFEDWPRAHWGGDTFHQREPRGGTLQVHRPIAHGQGGILHLWAASERRLIAKHALYKCNERLRWPQKPVTAIEKMYNWAIKGDPTVPAYGTPATWKYAETTEAWLAPYKNLLQYLDIHAVPWQERETIRLVGLHGREAFRGLDLFGVA